MKKIQALENKYDLMAFRMSLAYLFEAGYSNFDDVFIEKISKEIQAEEETEKANGTGDFINPDFKREILACAVELSKFSIFTLFAYIKKHFVIDI